MERLPRANMSLRARFFGRGAVIGQGPVNTDDICAHISEYHAAKRPWPDARELNNLYPGKRSHNFFLCSFCFLVGQCLDHGSDGIIRLRLHLFVGCILDRVAHKNGPGVFHAQCSGLGIGCITEFFRSH